MKSVVVLFMMFCFLNSIGQNDIITNLDESGKLVGVSIVDFNEKPAEEIYKKTEEWVAYTFANKESVTQSMIENKMFGLKGISKSALGPYMGYYFDLAYNIQIDIKDNKLRFSASNLGQLSQSSMTNTPLEKFYKKGKLKKNKNILKFKEQTDSTLSNLLASLVSYINGEEKVESDEW